MTSTATLYLAYDEDGDLQVFTKKPKAYRQRRHSAYGGIVTETFGTSYWDAATQVDNDIVRKLVGRGVPANKIMKLQLKLNPKAGVADRVVIAAPTEVGVGLFKKEPKLAPSSRWTPSRGYSDLPTANGGEATFCTPGFETATGLTMPEESTIRLGLTVLDIIDIPLRSKILPE